MATPHSGSIAFSDLAAELGLACSGVSLCTISKTNADFPTDSTYCISNLQRKIRFDVTGTPKLCDLVEYVVIGGGGGAMASNTGVGGSGAGGYLSSVFGECSGCGSGCLTSLVLIKNCNYGVSIGAGGAGAVFSGTTTDGSRGGNSCLSSPNNTIVSCGGGATSTVADCRSGGSGAGATQAGVTVYDFGIGVFQQGNSGGCKYSKNTSGGGGGARCTGCNGTLLCSGDGGSGEVSSIRGTPVYRAGGGGGGKCSTLSGYCPGCGGCGGGGDGGLYTGCNGFAYTGGGAGGARKTTVCDAAANGGSGIVIIRYPNTITASVSNGVGQSCNINITGTTLRYTIFYAGAGTFCFS